MFSRWREKREERGGIKDMSSDIVSLSLFFFLREECDRFRNEDRSGGIVEDEIEKFHNNVGRKIRV